MNLATAIEFHAQSRPRKVALVSDAGELTYEELSQRLSRAHARLLKLGLEEGMLVGVCLKDTIEHVLIIYALARAGMIMMPMDCRWSIEEQHRLVSHFRPDAVIMEAGTDALEATKCIEVAAIVEEEGFDTAPPPADGDELPLLVSLSSGTTGRPKGPRITHQNMLRRFWTHWINLGLNSNSRYISATPLYFGGGRTFAMSVLYSGGTLILFPPPFKVEALCDAATHHRATSTFLVPTQLRRLLELPDERLRPVKGLDLLISSGAPLFSEERRAMRQRVCANLFEYYASTEGGGVSLSTPEDQSLYPDSVGRAVFAVEIEIVGDDHKPVAPGTVGLLRYRGPGVATSYFGADANSGDAFRDGWFYPGDIAEKNEAGYVFIRGRAKDVIIRGGINIYAAEVESVLSAHPAVAESAVVGRPSRIMGEEVAAFVVLREAAEPEDLGAWCRERLAPYKVPRDFLAIDVLPRNSAGKVLKADLAAGLEAV